MRKLCSLITIIALIGLCFGILSAHTITGTLVQNVPDDEDLYLNGKTVTLLGSVGEQIGSPVVVVAGAFTFSDVDNGTYFLSTNLNLAEGVVKGDVVGEYGVQVIVEDADVEDVEMIYYLYLEVSGAVFGENPNGFIISGPNMSDKPYIGISGGTLTISDDEGYELEIVTDLNGSFSIGKDKKLIGKHDYHVKFEKVGYATEENDFDILYDSDDYVFFNEVELIIYRVNGIIGEPDVGYDPITNPTAYTPKTDAYVAVKDMYGNYYFYSPDTNYAGEFSVFSFIGDYFVVAIEDNDATEFEGAQAFLSISETTPIDVDIEIGVLVYIPEYDDSEFLFVIDLDEEGRKVYIDTPHRFRANFIEDGSLPVDAELHIKLPSTLTWIYFDDGTDGYTYTHDTDTDTHIVGFPQLANIWAVIELESSMLGNYRGIIDYDIMIGGFSVADGRVLVKATVLPQIITYDVFGYAVDEDENPVEDVVIIIGNTGFARDARTDADGYYIIKNVPVGNYTISANGGWDYAMCEPDTISVNNDDVERNFIMYPPKHEPYYLTTYISGYNAVIEWVDSSILYSSSFMREMKNEGYSLNDIKEAVKSRQNNHSTSPTRAALGFNIYKDGVKLNEELHTSTTYNLTLSPENKDYDIAVSAVYVIGESRQTKSKIKVRTHSLPYLETFDNPEDHMWSDINLSTPGWTQFRGLLDTTAEYESSAYYGCLEFWMYDYSAELSLNYFSFIGNWLIDEVDTRDWLITPSINLQSHSKLSFDMGFDTWDGDGHLADDASFALYISTDNGITWNEDKVLKSWTLDELDDLIGEEIFVEVDLDKYPAGLVKFGFYGEADDLVDIEIFIDNFIITSDASGKDGITPLSTNYLKNNYPNPFNPETTISYHIAQPGMVKLNIYNIKGQKVKTLVNENNAVGDYNILWNGIDDNGKDVSSGIYFYRLESNDYTSTKKMILMK